MADILVRDVDPETLNRLKERARRNGRSLQSEAKRILQHAATLSPDEARRLAGAWQKRLAGREFTDSVELIREDRRR